jgi:hypothetical protein
MCGADPSGGPPCSTCFARAVERKNLELNLAHQRRNDRDGEENCKAVANTLRKIRTVPAEQNPLKRVPRHETPRSNASFETQHRPPAEFPGLPSWEQSVAHRMLFCETKIAQPFSRARCPPVSGRDYSRHAPPLRCQSRRDTLPFNKSQGRLGCPQRHRSA